MPKDKKINQNVCQKAIKAALNSLNFLDYSSISKYNSSSSNQSTYKCITQANILEKNNLLKAEIKLLKEKNNKLKYENKNFKFIQEELETFKNLGTCPLKLALKYPTPQLPQIDSSVPTQLQKKRRTMLFARLLNNDESLKQLKEIDELEKSKTKAIKQKKEKAMQKKEKIKQKKEEAMRKKKKIKRKKEEIKQKKEEAAQ
ncbi:20848_t:CDS:2, partial [Gigaspora margarita]